MAYGYNPGDPAYQQDWSFIGKAGSQFGQAGSSFSKAADTAQKYKALKDSAATDKSVVDDTYKSAVTTLAAELMKDEPEVYKDQTTATMKAQTMVQRPLSTAKPQENLDYIIKSFSKSYENYKAQAKTKKQEQNAGIAGNIKSDLIAGGSVPSAGQTPVTQLGGPGTTTPGVPPANGQPGPVQPTNVPGEARRGGLKIFGAEVPPVKTQEEFEQNFAQRTSQLGLNPEQQKQMTSNTGLLAEKDRLAQSRETRLAAKDAAEIRYKNNQTMERQADRSLDWARLKQYDDFKLQDELKLFAELSVDAEGLASYYEETNPALQKTYSVDAKRYKDRMKAIETAMKENDDAKLKPPKKPKSFAGDGASTPAQVTTSRRRGTLQ